MTASSSAARSSATHTATREEALIELYKRLRPGEPANVESARSLLDGLFFNPQRYDLGKVGRFMLNRKLRLGVPEEVHTLTNEDVVGMLKFLFGLWEQDYREHATEDVLATLRAKYDSIGSAPRIAISKWTTSTTSATAAFAPWASSSRTSSASVLRAWSVLSASA